MQKNQNDKFDIIRDTREKEGVWDFSFEGHQMVSKGMKTGDYSIVGMEDIITIERKKSTSEMALNLGKFGKRFEAEFVRMEEFRFSHLICEFSREDLEAFPDRSTVPKYKRKYIKVRGKFLFSKLTNLCGRYGTYLYFCNNKQEAEILALKLLTEAYDVVQSEI